MAQMDASGPFCNATYFLESSKSSLRVALGIPDHMGLIWGCSDDSTPVLDTRCAW